MLEEFIETNGSGRSDGRPGLSYRFADLSLNPGKRQVTRDNEPIHLGRLTYQMLQVLVESAPNVVSQDDFARKVWRRRVVSPETVAQRVKILRDALCDRAVESRYVGVVRGHGYRLLQDVQAVASECTREERVAVLPFESFSSELRDAYFADGLHEEILTHLAGVDSLGVIARTSVKQYEGTKLLITEIVEELEVGCVMEDSVRYAGDCIRVTAQLIDGLTGEHLWAEIYEQDLEDVFATQTDIASQITSRLNSEALRALSNSPDLSRNGHSAARAAP